jgi:hypothetical protein
MGWRGFLRAVEADMRRSARASEKREKIEQKIANLNHASEVVSTFNNAIETMTSLHKQAPKYNFDWSTIYDEEPIEPVRLTTNEAAAQSKFNNFQPGFIQKVFGLEERSKLKLQKAIKLSADKDEEWFQSELSIYNQRDNDWSKKKQYAEKFLSKDFSSYIELIQEYNPFINIGDLGTEIGFSVNDKGTLTANIQLHSEGIFPKEKYTIRQSGTLSNRQMPKGEFYSIYQDYVCSCILRIASELFALLPLQYVIINAKDHLLNASTGFKENQTILSALVVRETFEKLNLSQTDPSEAMKNFKHIVKFKKTTGFESVTEVHL